MTNKKITDVTKQIDNPNDKDTSLTKNKKKIIPKSKNILVLENNLPNNAKKSDTSDKSGKSGKSTKSTKSTNSVKIDKPNKPNKKNKKSNDYFKELLHNQLQNVPTTKKLTYNDIKRISKFISSSIFDETKCSLWNGYITNEKNQSKGTYINFYFNQKKIALHRLLYLNFIGEILNTEYIKFSCVNKGKCCNVNHMKKFSYNLKQQDKPDEVVEPVEKNNVKPVNPQVNNTHSDNSVHIVQNKNELTIEL
jgi:hypothetical protein